MATLLVCGKPRDAAIADVRAELKAARRGNNVAQVQAIALLVAIVDADGKRIAELERRRP